MLPGSIGIINSPKNRIYRILSNQPTRRDRNTKRKWIRRDNQTWLADVQGRVRNGSAFFCDGLYMIYVIYGTPMMPMMSISCDDNGRKEFQRRYMGGLIG